MKMKKLSMTFLIVTIVITICLIFTEQIFAYECTFNSPSTYCSTTYFNNSASSCVHSSISLDNNIKNVSTSSVTSKPTITITKPIHITNTSLNSNTSVTPVKKTVTKPKSTTVSQKPKTTTKPTTVSQKPSIKMKIVKIAEGTEYETPMYVFDSGVSGKTVWVNGGTHGNETSGYKAALNLLTEVKSGKIAIKNGKLIILPEANILADESHKRFAPDGINLNLAFPKTKTDPEPTYVLAKSIWDQLKKYHLDYFLDLHESIDYHRADSTNTGQSIIYMPIKDGKTITNKIISELDKDITNSIAKYSVLRYPVPGSIARASSECLGTVSFIAEACDNESLTTRINEHVNTAKYLLKFVGMI